MVESSLLDVVQCVWRNQNWLFEFLCEIIDDVHDFSSRSSPISFSRASLAENSLLAGIEKNGR
jgi:hypothetical protein